MKSLQISNQEFFALAEKMLLQGKPVDIRVKGNSMRPFLSEGEIVTIVPLPTTRKLSKGIIILTKTNLKKVMMHRICRIEGETITMQGDGNLRQKEVIHRSQILGIAETFKKKDQNIPLYSPIRRLSADIWRFYPLRWFGLFLIRILHH